jgi:hypothetical protein
MSLPAQFAYTYESKQQSERPANNATYLTSATQNDPNFKWQNSGQRTSRGATVWVRATKRRVTPEYKAFLGAEKARREAEFDILSGLLSSMSMTTSPTNTGKNNYATSLITGKPGFVRREELAAAAQQAAQLKSEINALSSMLASSGMEGGKKRRHTKRRHHSKHRHTRRR